MHQGPAQLECRQLPSAFKRTRSCWCPHALDSRVELGQDVGAQERRAVEERKGRKGQDRDWSGSACSSQNSGAVYHQRLGRTIDGLGDEPATSASMSLLSFLAEQGRTRRIHTRAAVKPRRGAGSWAAHGHTACRRTTRRRRRPSSPVQPTLRAPLQAKPPPPAPAPTPPLGRRRSLVPLTSRMPGDRTARSHRQTRDGARQRRSACRGS